MPYADPAKRRDRQALYRQTPAGQRAAQRSHDRFKDKRREQSPGLTVNPAPLAQALTAWRTQ